MGSQPGQAIRSAELPGFGLLDHDDTMELLAAAADNPATRWCVTVTDPATAPRLRTAASPAAGP